MNALATSLGRLPTMRRRESKKQVKPINVDAAQKFVPAAGPSSSSTLTTPKPSDFLSAGSSLTPPHSPSTACPVKSPLRRAFSRTFFFVGHGSSSSFNNNNNTTSGSSGGSSSGANNNSSGRDSHSRSATPLQISAPLMEPYCLTSSPDSFDMASPRTAISHRRSSKTLLPPLPIIDTKNDLAPTRSMRRPASSSSRIRSFWGGDSSTESSPSMTTSPTMRQASLRSIRQLHQRALSTIIQPVTPELEQLAEKPRAPPAPIAPANPSRRLLRRASEESFFCRGLDYDASDASSIPDVPLTAPLPGLASRRMSNFTKDAHGLFDVGISTLAGQSLVSGQGDVESFPRPLTGLGFTDCSPPAPRPKTKRLSVASQVSDVTSVVAESFYSSTSSVQSTATSETTTSSPRSSWPEVPTQWFSSCPPTPPSAIRLKLQFLSLPCKTGTVGAPSALIASTDSEDGQPVDALFVSSNNSVLDLKEIIAERLRSKGFRILPKELSLSLNFADSLYQLTLAGRSKSPLSSSSAASALGLAFNEEGCSPIKHLANNSRLLFEEGAQEDDTVVVRYLPHEVSAKFF